MPVYEVPYYVGPQTCKIFANRGELLLPDGRPEDGFIMPAEIFTIQGVKLVGTYGITAITRLQFKQYLELYSPLNVSMIGDCAIIHLRVAPEDLSSACIYMRHSYTWPSAW